MNIFQITSFFGSLENHEYGLSVKLQFQFSCADFSVTISLQYQIRQKQPPCADHWKSPTGSLLNRRVPRTRLLLFERLRYLV